MFGLVHWNPELLTAEDLNRLSAQPKFCPQFHLSLQSGCDRTLKAMNRHYDSAEYRRIVEDIRKAFENPSITTDIMVGFPGETEEDFQQSADFAKEIGLAKAHVFAYSVRPGTRAASMPDQVPQREKETRSAPVDRSDRQDPSSLFTVTGGPGRRCPFRNDSNALWYRKATRLTIRLYVWKQRRIYGGRSGGCGLRRL